MPLDAEPAQQVDDQQNHKDRAKTYARASARPPPGMAVVSSASAEKQYQNDYQYQHAVVPFELRLAKARLRPRGSRSSDRLLMRAALLAFSDSPDEVGDDGDVNKQDCHLGRRDAPAQLIQFDRDQARGGDDSEVFRPTLAKQQPQSFGE